MPRLSIDYSKTIIYKLVCKDINIKELYVGHTTDFTSRKYCHKSRCNNLNSEHYNSLLYQFIRENGNWENWEMVMIEEVSCTNAIGAAKQERLRIEELQATLNSYLPTKTLQEHREDTRIWRENNVEHIKNYNQKWNKNIICECGVNCSLSHIARHKKSPFHINYIKSTAQV